MTPTLLQICYSYHNYIVEKQQNFTFEKMVIIKIFFSQQTDQSTNDFSSIFLLLAGGVKSKQRWWHEKKDNAEVKYKYLSSLLYTEI